MKCRNLPFICQQEGITVHTYYVDRVQNLLTKKISTISVRRRGIRSHASFMFISISSGIREIEKSCARHILGLNKMKKIALFIVALSALMFASCDSGDSGSSYSNDQPYNVSFQGQNGRSCNIPGHNCSGFLPSAKDNMICARCAANGYICHKVKH